MTSSAQPDPASEAHSANEKAVEEYPMPTSQPMLLRGVRWGIIITIASMVLFSGIGYLVSATEGLLGGLIGAAIGGILLLATVGSIAFGNRFAASPMYLQIFFSIVLGTWVVKLLAFVVVAVLLKNQTWLDSQMLFISLVATVIASIVMDTVIVARARVPLGVS